MSDESTKLLAAVLETITPSGILPEPRAPSRGKRGTLGRTLRLFTKSPKAAALARIKWLPIQQCGRGLLAIYVHHARGARARSWMKDETVAAMLPRSGKRTTYSVAHVRRWRRLLEDLGLVRSTFVRMGEALPNGETPDTDDGLTSETGQVVVEVNMNALLGLEPLWPPPVRGGGWQAAREARAAVEELRAELEAQAAARAELEPPAAPERDAEPLPESAATPAPAPEGVIMEDHRAVIFQDHPSSDPGFSSGETISDPARSYEPREDASPPATRTPAHAGSSREGGASPPGAANAVASASPQERVESETPPSACATDAPRSGPRLPREHESESESDGGKEQRRSQAAAVVEPPATRAEHVAAMLDEVLGADWRNRRRG